mmetsp:Transcript_34569/g.68001  ORF Transcript_34569/g.68001 Transcript_34569/m.68001 type:complete len:357 (-) Transcript_34569:1302-2372(-)
MQKKNKKQPVDEDLAIKPVNPLIDHGLGVVFIALVGRLGYELLHDKDLGILFAVSFVGVIIAAQATVKVAIVVGRWISQARVSESIPISAQRPLKTKLAMRKFSDQAWQLMIHFSMTLYELYLLQGTEWWNSPGTCFVPCPASYVAGENQHSWELRVFYVVQLATWVWTGFSCKWLEARRKDYVEMMLHHCMTIMLVLFSFVQGELAIGLSVLFAHDASDVVLDLMKMANYLKLEDGHGMFVTEILFVSNLLGWIYFRLYRFPVFVIYEGVWKGYPDNCGLSSANNNRFDRCMSIGTCMQSFVLLCGLCVLHLYWFALLVRIAMKIASKGASNAGKEEYEGASGSDYLSDTDKKQD